MNLKENHPINRMKILCLLAVLIAIVYSNSFQAGWHFDDRDHILFNQAVHPTNFSVDAIVRAIYAAPRHDDSSPPKIYRPLASLSFALNWYFGGPDVFGYHLVNVGIHCLAAVFLFLSISYLYKTPRMELYQDGQENFVPLLAAVLWALSPIQTQAVTYIVQRMATMAAMFCILTLFLYLKGRLSHGKTARLSFFIGAGAAFCCAMASKENATVFPISLVLAEFVFFRPISLKSKNKKVLVLCGIAILALIASGILLFSNGAPLSIFNGYGMRPYTLIERIMTQPRVLLFYLSQLFYPVATRLSFQHDIFHSTALLSPWTTLPSIMLVLSLITFACFRIRRLPLLSFAILFFFLNHMVESTILPLELVFEHRNYLPSMFLFLPVASGIWRFFAYYRSQRSGLYYILVGFIILLITCFGWSTHVRNMAWSTELSLWQDALKKAPGSIRPYSGLAHAYENLGDRRSALDLYEQALDKYSERPNDYRTVILNNIGKIYFAEGNYDQAIKIWSDAILRVKDYNGLRSNLALVFARQKKWDKALAQLDRLLERLPGNPQYNFLKGSYLIETGRLDAAIHYLRKAYRAGYDPPKTLANIGIVYYHKQNYTKAERFLMWASSGRKKPPEMLIWLLAVNLKLDDRKDSDYYAEQLLKTVSVSGINSWLELISVSDHHLYRDKEQIMANLKVQFSKQSDYLTQY
jgi:Tfp pilus assembly protein PilF